MAGHSQFKNIMHRKGAQDARKAKVFTKVGREIIVAVKSGGGADPGTNNRLRAAITWAREVNMPGDRIKRAIDTGLGNKDSDNYQEIRYEGYGPGGVAIIIDALSDNRNRTAAEIRGAFTEFGGNLGETNSVSFMFDRMGEIVYPLKAAGAEALFEAVVDAGADDCQTGDTHHEIYTAPAAFSSVREALEKKFGAPERAALVWKPNVMAAVNEEQARDVMALVETLEDDDDVQTVTTNFEVSDDVMKKLMAS